MQQQRQLAVCLYLELAMHGRTSSRCHSLRRMCLHGEGRFVFYLLNASIARFQHAGVPGMLDGGAVRASTIITKRHA